MLTAQDCQNTLSEIFDIWERETNRQFDRNNVDTWSAFPPNSIERYGRYFVFFCLFVVSLCACSLLVTISCTQTPPTLFVAVVISGHCHSPSLAFFLHFLCLLLSFFYLHRKTYFFHPFFRSVSRPPIFSHQFLKNRTNPNVYRVCCGRFCLSSVYFSVTLIVLVFMVVLFSFSVFFVPVAIVAFVCVFVLL